MAGIDRPSFVVIGGPNGSGKSSAYGGARFDETPPKFWIVNPDLLAARLRDAEGLPPLDANVQAVHRIEAWLEATLRTHSSVGVETVLSTGKYRRLVELAKSLGFEFRLFYVVLDTPERNVERVRLRVLKGGHDVPREKIFERWARSLQQLPWFLDAADSALLYDNSGHEARLVGWKEGARVTLDPTAPAALCAALGA